MFRKAKHILLILSTIVTTLTLGSCHSSRKALEDDYGRNPRFEKMKGYPEIKQKKRNKTTGHGVKIVEEALTWKGTPYKYGGSSKGIGTDCSGMVCVVYEKISGIKIPRNSRKQAEFCKTISHREVRAGDLVFFATGKSANIISHVGIMIDDGRFIHASSKKGVIVSDISTPYYTRTFKMFGRIEK